MNINRRNFLFGSAAAATLAGCATNKVGLRPLAADSAHVARTRSTATGGTASPSA